MKNFSVTGNYFLLGGLNFFGSLVLVLLFAFIPTYIWESLNAIWQFAFLVFFIGLLFDLTPKFMGILRAKHPKATMVFESFGWIPYAYVLVFTALAVFEIANQVNEQYEFAGIWFAAFVPVIISLIILYDAVQLNRVRLVKPVAVVKAAVKAPVKKAVPAKKTAAKKVAKKTVAKKVARPVAKKKAKKAKKK